MRRICMAIMLCISAVCFGKPGKWDLQVSPNQRFLQYADGTPFFWLGDTGWLLPTKPDRDEVKQYLAGCRENGFNVVQVQTLCGVPCVNVYGQYSNNRHEPWDMSYFDNSSMTYTYWDHMDYIISEAERNGIYIAMDCIWGGLVKSGLMDTEQAELYGTFLAERYKNSPNIIWLIAVDDCKGYVGVSQDNIIGKTVTNIKKDLTE